MKTFMLRKDESVLIFDEQRFKLSFSIMEHAGMRVQLFIEVPCVMEDGSPSAVCKAEAEELELEQPLIMKLGEEGKETGPVEVTVTSAKGARYCVEVNVPAGWHAVLEKDLGIRA